MGHSVRRNFCKGDELKMSHCEVLGANIPRVDAGIKQALLDAVLIYIGKDDKLHVREQKISLHRPLNQSRDMKKHKHHSYAIFMQILTWN